MSSFKDRTKMKSNNPDQEKDLKKDLINKKEKEKEKVND